MDSIIQWNCRGLKENYNELQLISYLNPITVCLQETYIKDADNMNVKNYTKYNLYATIENGKPSGDVSILISNEVAHQEENIFTYLQAKIITITAGKKFTLCFIYLLPQSGIEDRGRNNNSKMKVVKYFIVRQNLVHLNDKIPTYVHPGHNTLSTLGLAICHPVLALVIITWSSLAPLSEPNEEVTHWNFNHADWNKFKHLSEERFSVELVEDVNIDGFISEVHKIAEKCFPKRSATKKKQRYPCFNKDCKQATESRYKALDVFWGNFHPVSIISNTRLPLPKLIKPYGKVTGKTQSKDCYSNVSEI